MPTLSSDFKSDAASRRSPAGQDKRKGGARGHPDNLSAQTVVENYPLSSLQQGMLFHAISEPGSGVDIEQMVIALREAVDVARLQNAWKQVVARHPILRTSFQWEGLRGEPQQQVWSAVEVEIATLDLNGHTAEAQETIASQWLKDDRQMGFQMDEPPPDALGSPPAW